MTAAERDSVDVLAAIRNSGGTILPIWAPQTERGFIYAVDGVTLEEHALESLVEHAQLDRTFTERISRCPSCRSHLLNMREVCIACKSPHIEFVELLHHFRCGYVAPTAEFVPEGSELRCPKCHGIMRNRGTDHDVPGTNFNCVDCGIFFQLPEIGAICFKCGRTVQGAELEGILYEDVFAYKLTSLGESVLRDGVQSENE